MLNAVPLELCCLCLLVLQHDVLVPVRVASTEQSLELSVREPKKNGMLIRHTTKGHCKTARTSFHSTHALEAIRSVRNYQKRALRPFYPMPFWSRSDDGRCLFYIVVVTSKFFVQPAFELRPCCFFACTCMYASTLDRRRDVTKRVE